jgi:sucrose-6-phosphate hydrolase SacC (GH32 family)
MVLFVEESEMDFFTSTDLKNWTKVNRLKSFHECPELFELLVDGDQDNRKWVLYGAAGDYVIGSFDGKELKPETEGIRFNYGNAFYASQTFSDIPEEDGRRLLMGWGQVPMPGMPWNQMITFPVALSLRTTDQGIRMYAEPVEEVAKLHKKKHSFSDETIDGTKTLDGIDGELFHIKAEFEVSDADSFGLIIREYNITYDIKENNIICTGPKNNFDPEDFPRRHRNELREASRFSEPHSAPLKPVDGKITLEILVDRTMVEVFPNNGRYYFPMGAYLVDRDPAIKVFSEGGKTKLKNLEDLEINCTNLVGSYYEIEFVPVKKHDCCGIRWFSLRLRHNCYLRSREGIPESLAVGWFYPWPDREHGIVGNCHRCSVWRDPRLQVRT